MFWYVIFVLAGKENKVERFLNRQLDTDVFTPFVPLHECLFKNKGMVKKEIKPLFPSYVFIESEIPGREFIKKVSNIFHLSYDIIKLLKYSDKEIAMRESERQMLLGLSNDDHCIESSSGFKEGSRIYITDGPLKGLESIIKKIDRHRRKAWIEIEFMGEIRLFSLGLELLNKI